MKFFLITFISFIFFVMFSYMIYGMFVELETDWFHSFSNRKIWLLIGGRKQFFPHWIPGV